MGLIGARRDAGKEKKEKPGKKKQGEPLTDSIRSYRISTDTIKLMVYKKDLSKLKKAAEEGDNKEARIAAIKGLVKLEDEGSILFLEEISRTDPEEEVKDAAVEAILKLKGEEKEFAEKDDVEELDISEIVDDDDADFIEEPESDEDFPDFEVEDPEAEEILKEKVRESRIDAFVDGDDSHMHFIIEMATIDGNETLKKKAMFALVESDDREALDSIQLILNSMDEDELGSDEVREKKEIQRKLNVKKAVITAKEFLKGDESKLSEIAKMLYDEKDIEIRKMAFETLIITKNPQGLETLSLYLADEGADEGELNFKRYLLKEMDDLKDLRFVDIFMEVLRFSTDAGVIDRCIQSLFMYGDKRALEVLEYTANREDLDNGRRFDASRAVDLLREIK